MNFALIGCGSVGRKRLSALKSTQQRLVAVVDLAIENANNTAKEYNAVVATTDWESVVNHKDVDAIIISTTHDWLAPITLAAVQMGKHVLVEKPAARNVEELTAIISAAEQRRVCVQVGFNHRYHPAFQKARQIFESGDLGKLMYVRGRYGHGGRLGYEREWRANLKISGGGELIDQGVHLIDLARWFLGDFAYVNGYTNTYFWDTPVEDNAFFLLRTIDEQAAWLHTSWTEWKNLFSFEIFGRKGKLQIDGLGGSYGQERLSFYQMSPEMGPPKELVWDYPDEDISWRNEINAFVRAIENKTLPEVTLYDAKAVLTIVNQIYEGVKK